MMKTNAGYEDTLKKMLDDYASEERLIIICKDSSALANVFTDEILAGRSVAVICETCIPEECNSEIEAFKSGTSPVLGIGGVHFGHDMIELLQDQAKIIYIDLSGSPLSLMLLKVVAVSKGGCVFVFNANMHRFVEHNVLNVLRLPLSTLDHLSYS